jgi:hypothetical protein
MVGMSYDFTAKSHEDIRKVCLAEIPIGFYE